MGISEESFLLPVGEFQEAGVYALYLNYHQLRSIPDALFESEICRKCLQKLYLKGNLINQLPSHLMLLVNLKELYLPANYLQTLPEELSGLQSLESLTVSHNQLTSLPAALGTMASLKSIDVSHNNISLLPDELWVAPCLECFTAAGNKLASLSPAIAHCQSLQTLILDSNSLTELPLHITLLTNLRYLSVCRNDLTALPSDFSALSKLETVYVDGNCRLHSIPLSLAGIQSLGVHGCNVLFSEHLRRNGMGEYDRVGSTLMIRAPHQPVPPLMEQAALAFHNSLTRVSPQGLLSLLHQALLLTPFIPTSVSPWLFPRGRCASPLCTRSKFFLHRFSCLVSLLTLQNLTILQPGISNHGKIPEDTSVCLDFCSRHCSRVVLSASL